MLIDSFNRKINYLRVSVTDKCNLRCLYCMPEEGIKLLEHNNILTLEDLYFFIKTSANLGVTKVRITGGEPLIRKNITFLIEKICKIDKINDISITTNGILLQKYIRELYNAGIKRINISLDTLKREKFKFITRRDYFDMVIAGIKSAVSIGMKPVKVNIVAIKNFNDDEIIDFVKFGIENNVQIRFIEFMPFGDFHNLRFISKKEIINIIKKVFKLNKVKKIKQSPADLYEISGFNQKVGFISPLTEHFCQQCNRLRLTCNGAVRTCLFADTSYNLFKLIKSGDSKKLEDNLIQIIKEKPEKHKIDIKDYKFKKCQNEMRVIGG